MSNDTESQAPRRAGALNRSHIWPERAKVQAWHVEPPAGSLPNDLCQPDYWKHVAADVGVKPGDDVRAMCADGTWFAEYLVLHVGAQHAKLQLLREYSLVEVSELVAKTKTHEPKWMGPAHKWVARRISDGETIKHGFESQAAVEAWLLQNATAIAA